MRSQIMSSGITARSGRMNITVGYHQTNRKTDTGKTLKLWPVLVDHYKKIAENYHKLLPS